MYGLELWTVSDISPENNLSFDDITANRPTYLHSDLNKFCLISALR